MATFIPPAISLSPPSQLFFVRYNGVSLLLFPTDFSPPSLTSFPFRLFGRPRRGGGKGLNCLIFTGNEHNESQRKGGERRKTKTGAELIFLGRLEIRRNEKGTENERTRRMIIFLWVLRLPFFLCPHLAGCLFFGGGRCYGWQEAACLSCRSSWLFLGGF